MIVRVNYSGLRSPGRSDSNYLAYDRLFLFAEFICKLSTFRTDLVLDVLANSKFSFNWQNVNSQRHSALPRLVVNLFSCQ